MRKLYVFAIAAALGFGVAKHVLADEGWTPPACAMVPTAVCGVEVKATFEDGEKNILTFMVAWSQNQPNQRVGVISIHNADWNLKRSSHLQAIVQVDKLSPAIHRIATVGSNVSFVIRERDFNTLAAGSLLEITLPGEATRVYSLAGSARAIAELRTAYDRYIAEQERKQPKFNAPRFETQPKPYQPGKPGLGLKLNQVVI